MERRLSIISWDEMKIYLFTWGKLSLTKTPELVDTLRNTKIIIESFKGILIYAKYIVNAFNMILLQVKVPLRRPQTRKLLQVYWKVSFGNFSVKWEL